MAALLSDTVGAPMLLRRRWSFPTRPDAMASLFYPCLPQVSSATLQRVIMELYHRRDRGAVQYVVLNGATRLGIRIIKRVITCGERRACLSIQHIEVQERHRREGHARRAIASMREHAANAGLPLIVEDVISEHMLKLLTMEFGAESLGSRRCGEELGCDFHVPGAPEGRAMTHVRLCGAQRAETQCRPE